MIGRYVVRCSDAGKAVSLAHLVESEIADRLVMRCGREMHRRNDDGTLRIAGGTDRTCFWCASRRDVAPDRVSDTPEPTATEQDDWSPV